MRAIEPIEAVCLSVSSRWTPDTTIEKCTRGREEDKFELEDAMAGAQGCGLSRWRFLQPNTETVKIC